MPDEKISTLPLTPAINLDDTYEKSRHNAAPSERATHQQLVTFMQTAMALLQLSGGNIKLNADGSVTFGKQNFADGSLTLLDALTGSNMISLSGNDGSARFAQEQSSLNADGGARFASGAATIAADGSASFSNGSATIAADGSAQFASGGATVNAGGEVTGLNLFSNGNVNLTGVVNNNSIQVIGAQQPAIPDATSTLDVVDRVNDILNELRAHGLIAT